MSKTAQWDPVRELMKGTFPVTLDKRVSDWFYHSPQSLLNYLTYYKFCTKMIGAKRDVLHLDCKEGIGTYILHTECSRAVGVAKDEEELEAIALNKYPNDFFLEESLDKSCKYDAVVCLEEEKISSEFSTEFVTDEGLVILGLGDFTKVVGSDFKRAKELLKRGEETYTFLFSFSAQNEIIKPGLIEGSNYYFFIGSKKR